MTIVKKTGRFKYLYGPVSSWRLGSSLGIDPISTTGKICSFDCLYCQLGSGAAYTRKRRLYVPTEEIIKEIEQLPKDLAIDYFTFSGRGEPTLALNIGEIIRKLRTIRKEKIAVITNASLMDKISLRRELALADFVEEHTTTIEDTNLWRGLALHGLERDDLALEQFEWAAAWNPHHPHALAWRDALIAGTLDWPGPVRFQAHAIP